MAESPNPGAVCPDRTQWSGWEGQGHSITTDGSYWSTTTCTHTHTHTQTLDHTWIKVSHSFSLERVFSCYMTNATFYNWTFLQYRPTIACGRSKTVINWLKLSYSTWCCVEEEKKGICSQNAWWDYKQMWLRCHRIQSRLEHGFLASILCVIL